MVVFTWIELDGAMKPVAGLFVAQVVGESMNRHTPHGAWCLWRLNPAGSLEGKGVRGWTALKVAFRT